MPLPGDPDPDTLLARMIRVDHAGEYGAERIYQGQLAILGRGPKADILRHMREQETVHKETFERLVGDRQVRPTALLPLWRAFLALGGGYPASRRAPWPRPGRRGYAG